MTSQAIEKKPLVLKDELAKFSRAASAEAWLKDAHAEIESWRASMPGMDRLQLTSVLDDGRSLEIRASDGWGQTQGFALYVIETRGAEPKGIRFHPGRAALLPDCTIGEEQAFISHLLQLLRKKFGWDD
jgi:hypothetical protein